MKVNEIVQTEKLEEAFFLPALAPWVLPTLATAVRIGTPALKAILRGGKKGSSKVGDTTKNLVQKSTTSGVIVGAGSMYVYERAKDVMAWIKENFTIDWDEDALEIFSQIVVKYGIPIGAIAAVLYGGKQLKDYMAGEEEKEKNAVKKAAVTEERVDEVLPVVGAVVGAIGRAALSRAAAGAVSRGAVANTISNADADDMSSDCSCGHKKEDCNCDPTCDCGCNAVKESKEMMTEAQFDEAAGEKDACYHKVKSRYKVWPSAYASGALVKCRKVGAKNWGNKSKK